MNQLTLPDLTPPRTTKLPKPRTVRAPMYRFDGAEGRVDLTGLFHGHRRLAVHHTMPDRSGPGAAAAASEISALLNATGTKLVIVSFAPYAKLVEYGRHFGFDLPAYSVTGTGFGADFPATRHLDGTGSEECDDAPGVSFFARDGHSVQHLGSIAVPYLDFLGLAGVTGDRRRD